MRLPALPKSTFLAIILQQFTNNGRNRAISILMHFHIWSYLLLWIFHYINLSGNRKKMKSIWKKILNDFIPLIKKFTKIYKKSQNLLKVLQKTVLFRNIALIFNLEKPCYLEYRVVRESCKRRSACIWFIFICTIYFVLVLSHIKIE